MADPAFDRLTDRQRECLRRVGDLQTVGQIATDLDLSVSTVRGHLDAANRLLGTRRTADAARLLREHEASVKAPIADPPIFTGQPERVASDPTMTAQAEQPRRMPRLPIRPRGAATNDLSLAERLLWIPVLAIIVAIGFGMLATGLDVLTRVIERLQHLAR